jgi:hypothetical protein
MKRVVILGSVLALVFAGCGLIPPIEVGDALQLGGKSTEVALSAATGATAQSSGSLSATFRFLDNPNINIPLAPSSFSYRVAISSVNFGTGCNLTGNTTVQIQNFTAVLSDAAFTDSARQPSATASNLSFTVAPGTGSLTVSNLIGNELTFNNLGNIGTILRQGGENTLALSGSVTTSPSVGNCTLTINWGAGTGTIRL